MQQLLLFLQPGSGQAAPGATSLSLLTPWLGHPSGLVGETQLQVCSGNVGNGMKRCSCLELPRFAGRHKVLAHCRVPRIWSQCGVLGSQGGRDGEGMCCPALGLFPLPFAEVSDELLCFPWALTISPRNLSPSLAAGSFSLPLLPELFNSLNHHFGCSLAKGKFPFPICDRIADCCLCFRKVFLLPFQPKLCMCKTCSSSLPSNFSGVACPKLSPVNEGRAVASSALPHTGSVKLFDLRGSLVLQKMRRHPATLGFSFHM